MKWMWTDLSFVSVLFVILKPTRCSLSTRLLCCCNANDDVNNIYIYWKNWTKAIASMWVGWVDVEICRSSLNCFALKLLSNFSLTPMLKKHISMNEFYYSWNDYCNMENVTSKKIQVVVLDATNIKTLLSHLPFKRRILLLFVANLTRQIQKRIELSLK